MGLETLAVLSAFVTVVVDRIRAVIPKIKGAWTNLVAVAVGVAVAIVGDLGTLAVDILPALETDAGLLADLVAGVALASGGALVDQLRQIGAGSPEAGSLDGQQ